MDFNAVPFQISIIKMRKKNLGILIVQSFGQDTKVREWEHEIIKKEV